VAKARVREKRLGVAPYNATPPLIVLMAQRPAEHTQGQRRFVMTFVEAEQSEPSGLASPRVVVLFVKGLIMDWELISLMRKVNDGVIPLTEEVLRDPGVEMVSYGVGLRHAQVFLAPNHQGADQPHAGSTSGQCALPLPLALLWARYGAPLEGNVLPVAVSEETFLQEKDMMTEYLRRMREPGQRDP
jgi:hypothetical protein